LGRSLESRTWSCAKGGAFFFSSLSLLFLSDAPRWSSSMKLSIFLLLQCLSTTYCSEGSSSQLNPFTPRSTPSSRPLTHRLILFPSSPSPSLSTRTPNLRPQETQEGLRQGIASPPNVPPTASSSGRFPPPQHQRDSLLQRQSLGRLPFLLLSLSFLALPLPHDLYEPSLTISHDNSLPLSLSLSLSLARLFASVSFVVRFVVFCSSLHGLSLALLPSFSFYQFSLPTFTRLALTLIMNAFFLHSLVRARKGVDDDASSRFRIGKNRLFGALSPVRIRAGKPDRGVYTYLK